MEVFFMNQLLKILVLSMYCMSGIPIYASAQSKSTDENKKAKDEIQEQGIFWKEYGEKDQQDSIACSVIDGKIAYVLPTFSRQNVQLSTTLPALKPKPVVLAKGLFYLKKGSASLVNDKIPVFCIQNNALLSACQQYLYIKLMSSYRFDHPSQNSEDFFSNTYSGDDKDMDPNPLFADWRNQQNNHLKQLASSEVSVVKTTHENSGPGPAVFPIQTANQNGKRNQSSSSSPTSTQKTEK
jgi:hypothetical protein